MSIDLRCGDWRVALADIGMVDCCICDPPYSERTHGAYQIMETLHRKPIGYSAWAADDVTALVDSWIPRVRGWFVALTDHGLIGDYEAALKRHGRYVFAPLACLTPGSRVRLTGDGPAQWSVFAIVARPATREFQRWGALPGGYVVSNAEFAKPNHGTANVVIGGKPLWLMQALVRDYSKPGDLVCDPCAGGATTLLAAAIEGRRAIGAELDPVTFAKAQARIAKGYTPSLFDREQSAAERLADRKHKAACICWACERDRASTRQQVPLFGGDK